MNATDLLKVANEVTNREKLDIVYNEILLPILKRTAEKKGKEVSIMDNNYNTRIGDRLKELGFKDDLQYLCRKEMKPYLIEKGFKISHSPYYTYISWYDNK